MVLVVTPRRSCACAATTVRDVCPTRTNERGRRRHQGKSAMRSIRSAWRARRLLIPMLAFKRAGGTRAPTRRQSCPSLRHNERRSVVKQRQQLLHETETLLSKLPEELRGSLPATKAVRPPLAALGRRDRSLVWEPTTALRLQLRKAG